MRDEPAPSPADPLGYYAVLGVGLLADKAEIRAAFRRQVKRLKPAGASAEGAVWELLEVNEAFRVLSDRRRRAEYDRSARQSSPFQFIDPEDPAPKPLACSRCGKVSAQPRYIVFHRVKGTLFKTHRDTIAGIFCRDCADRTAIRASTVTWLRGWWGPSGPYHTLKALIANLKGGERPRPENLRLLLHQARAFQARGDDDLVAALACQALPFARDGRDRQRIAAFKPERIHTEPAFWDRWAKGGHAVLVQSLPLAALVLSLLLVVSAVLLRDQTDRAAAAIVIPPAHAGEIRHVAVDTLKVRQGPSAEQPVVTLLDRFATVQVTDPEGGGEWVRIVTATGETGFVPARFLFGGPGVAAKTQWCVDNQGAPPENGELLLRRTGGEHVLAVRNDSGQDVVVRLKLPNGPTLLAFYVAKGATTSVLGVPTGSFRAIFATGRQFSHACGVFLDDMRAYVVPNAVLVTPGGKDAPFQIPPIGSASSQSKPLALDAFLDG